MNIVPASLWHLNYVCEHIREDEIEQFKVMRGLDEFNPDLAAARFYNPEMPQFTVIGINRMPAVVGGYSFVAPGVWESWMVGTEQGWRENWRTITKATLKMIGQMFESGARRLETVCLENRVKANEWHERSLHLKREGIKYNYGQNGENVVMFAAVKETWHGHSQR